jgi:hypothetical protein
MKKYAFSALLVMLGLVLGVGTSLAIFWSASSRFVANAAAAHADAEVAKLPPKPWDFWTIEMESLANDLRDERGRIKLRDDQLAQREARLNAEQQELEKTRKQIEEIRAAIDQRLIEVTDGEAANLKKLALTYGALTPEIRRRHLSRDGRHHAGQAVLADEARYRWADFRGDGQAIRHRRQHRQARRPAFGAAAHDQERQ